jgi:hypothetical protein
MGYNEHRAFQNRKITTHGLTAPTQHEKLFREKIFVEQALLSAICHHGLLGWFGFSLGVRTMYGHHHRIMACRKGTKLFIAIAISINSKMNSLFTMKRWNKTWKSDAMHELQREY